jgi:hypothetical protein
LVNKCQVAKFRHLSSVQKFLEQQKPWMPHSHLPLAHVSPTVNEPLATEPSFKACCKWAGMKATAVEAQGPAWTHACTLASQAWFLTHGRMSVFYVKVISGFSQKSLGGWLAPGMHRSLLPNGGAWADEPRQLCMSARSLGCSFTLT